MVSRPACISWKSAIKTQRYQVKFVNKDIDCAHRIGIADVAVEGLGGKVLWPRCSPWIKRLIGDPRDKNAQKS